MIDSHVHIDSESYRNLPESIEGVLAEAARVGVERVVAPSIHLDSYADLLEIQQAHPERVFPAAGVHPHDASESRNSGLAAALEKALNQAAVPIVGETGLEGHYDFTPTQVQLESLRTHLDLARVHNLPLILHCREMEELLYSELSRKPYPAGGVVHCFTGSWDWAQRFLELGFHIGITGIVTFKKSVQVQEVAARVPEDRLLVETDGPYLAPIPFRGKLNRPEYIPHIVEKIAELRETDAAIIGDKTAKNAEQLFRLPKR